MLHMSNVYYFVFSILLIINVYISSSNVIKINETLKLINEELIIDCVSYKGLIDATQEDNSKYLYLNQDKLKEMINDLLNLNLKNTTYKVEYFFYDYSTVDYSSVDKEYCNSVQIKITINYQNKETTKIFRFEPDKRGDQN